MSVTLGGTRRLYEVEAKIDANTAIKKGDHVGSYSSGNGFVKTITAATNIIPLGRARAAADNTGGAAGDKSIFVDTGREVFWAAAQNLAGLPAAARTSNRTIGPQPQYSAKP